jgi:hypothetical protein
MRVQSASSIWGRVLEEDNAPLHHNRLTVWGLAITCVLPLTFACGTSGSNSVGQGSSSSVGSTSSGSGSSGSVGSGSSGSGSAPSGVGGGGPVGGGSVSCDAEARVGASVLRRLSALEYQLTVQDLFALPQPPSADDIPLDNERLGFRTYAEYQTMSAENLRAYLSKASRLADELLADAGRRAKVIGCDAAEATCLSDFLVRFGKLSFRRPLEASERDNMLAAAAAASDAEDRVRFLIQALLASPNFLYRVEVGTSKEGLSTLSSFELAAKLSFALWGRSPDEALLAQAESGVLDTNEGLLGVARSMLADEKSRTFFASFFRQWLGYQTVRPPTPGDAAVFEDMQTETDRVAQEFAWSGSNFLDALTSNHTYLTPELAAFYGLGTPPADGRVEFATGNTRANSGLLTHASLLSAKTDGDLISIRGNWLRRTFLCRSLQIPAQLADTIGELLVGLDRVGIVQERNSQGVCAECHAAIDPIGIGFEQFNRSGAFDASIDPTVFGITSALPDAPAPNTFQKVSELASMLRQMPEVPACLTDRAFLYVHGREPSSDDTCATADVTQEFVTSGSSFENLVEAVVADPAFRLRRAPEPAP